MYTIRFYPRGSGSAPAVIISVGEGEWKKIMRELDRRFPEADNIKIDQIGKRLKVHFDLPQEIQAAA
jgi:hypothetical protein